MTRRLRVAVLMGGRSSEHEISQASARSVVDALADRHEVVTVAIGRDGHWELGAGSAAALEAGGGAAETLPVVSANGELTFWDLRDHAAELRDRLGARGVARLRAKTLADVPKVRAQGH